MLDFSIFKTTNPLPLALQASSIEGQKLAARQKRPPYVKQPWYAKFLNGATGGAVAGAAVGTALGKPTPKLNPAQAPASTASPAGSGFDMRTPGEFYGVGTAGESGFSNIVKFFNI